MTSHVVELGSCRAEIRLGRWEDVLADVTCDALITDPPYGTRTHKGHDSGAAQAGARQDIAYQSMTPGQAATFSDRWVDSVRGWTCVMTSHDLVDAWSWHGRLNFAPVWIVQNSVRLVGDGPASPGVYLMVSRPRTLEFARWGSLPGHYKAARGIVAPGTDKAYPGGKPIELMRQIVSDYSRPGDLVCDPCAGYGTTLAAALLTGRNAIGAEMDPAAYEQACRVLDMVSAQRVLGL